MALNNHSSFQSVQTVYIQWHPCKHIGLVNYKEQLSRTPLRAFGTKPARSSAFISVSRLLNADALGGMATPARHKTFNSPEATLNGNALSEVYAPAGIAMPERASTFHSQDTLMNADTLMC